MVRIISLNQTKTNTRSAECYTSKNMEEELNNVKRRVVKKEFEVMDLGLLIPFYE